MASIATKARNKLPADKFGLSETRQYPVDTTGRAANAKARSTQELAKGNLTPSQASDIKHHADVVLGQCDSTYHDCPAME